MVRDRLPLVVERLGELEGALDVLARGLPVALALVTAAPPAEMLERRRSDGSDERSASSSASVKSADAVAMEERFQRQQLELKQDFSAVDVRELGPLGDLAGLPEDLDRDADLAHVHPGPGLREEGPQLEARRRGVLERAADRRQHLDGLGVLVRFDRGLGTGDDALGTIAIARRDTGLEERPVDAGREAYSTVSPVGRVLPRSIWLRYSLENRSPARSVCVSPAVDAELANPVAQAGAARRARGGKRLRLNEPSAALKAL